MKKLFFLCSCIYFSTQPVFQLHKIVRKTSKPLLRCMITQDIISKIPTNIGRTSLIAGIMGATLASKSDKISDYRYYKQMIMINSALFGISGITAITLFILKKIK